MAGPLSGISQQVPFATTFQPNQESGVPVRPDGRPPRENTVQPRNAPAADAQKSATQDQNNLRAAPKTNVLALLNENTRRGALLDVSV